MIKKVIHIIITALLMFTTSGYSISKHYAGGELFSYSFFGDSERCCETECEYCNDITEFYQLDVDFITTNAPELAIPITLMQKAMIVLSEMVVRFEVVCDKNFMPPPNINAPTIPFLMTFRC